MSQLALTAGLMSVLLISQGPTLNDDLSASSSSSSAEISGLLNEEKTSGRSQTLALSSDEVRKQKIFICSIYNISSPVGKLMIACKMKCSVKKIKRYIEMYLCQY